MKKARKLLPIMLTIAMGITATFALAACDESYTTTETDKLIAELQATIDGNKSELDSKITALTEQYKAKDSELLAQITVNQQSIAAMQTEYAAKISVLELADETNAKAIEDLKSEYQAKITGLENAILAANATIESNKKELNGAISALTARYEAKMTDVDKLLETLQNTDTTQDEKIAELANKITALEQATRITGVQFADNGDLIVTFGDGSTQTVKAPEQHVHTFGEWTVFTDDDTPCENRLFFRVCADCNGIEWKQGAYTDHDFVTVTTAPTCQEQGYDTKTCDICNKVEKINYTPIVPHLWATEYSEDNSYHWYDCTTCDDINGKEEHTDNGEGVCSVCEYLIGPTAGVLYDVVDGKARVVGYEGTATRVRIAETYNGAPVTEICQNAFKDCNLTSVMIGNSVTSIGEGAFAYCSSLTSVVIGDGVTSIGNYAFRNCSRLTSITIPDGVTSIGSWAFYDCSSLTSVVIGDSVTSIGDYAFEYCSSLTSVVIGDGVTSIGDSAFYNCSSLTSVVIGDGVTSIGSYAFSGCDLLIRNQYGYATYLAVEGNPYFALLEVTNKNFSTYTIHENTKIICSGAFSNCSNLTNITILDSVTSIGDGAFTSCSSLTSVVIGDGVTNIDEWSFVYCDSLTSVVIGDSVTSIGDGAFDYCSSLTGVYYKGTADDWAKISIGDFNYKLTSATRYYYSESEPTEAGNYWRYVDGVPTKW